MTNRELFIQELEAYISHETTIPFSDGAWAYFQSLKMIQEKEKPMFTENGAKVLQYMQEIHTQNNNIFKAKDICEGLFLPSSRTVSGAMRKLITDGYVSKTGGNPVCYSLTETGKTIEVVFPTESQEEDA